MVTRNRGRGGDRSDRPDRPDQRNQSASVPRSARPSRGQLLLAGAFVLAVGIIGLTFVLNTSVQTTTMAESETGIARGGDAVSTREAVREDLGDFLTTLNQEYDEDAGVLVTDPWNEYRDAYRDGLPYVARGIRDHHAGSGRFVNLSAPSSLDDAFEDGFRVKQGTTDSFARPGTRTNPNPDGEWRLVRESQVRNATFVVEREIDPTASAFQVVFEEHPSGDEWAVEVYEQPTTPGNWRLVVTYNGAPIESCTGPSRSNPVRIDIGAARFGGEHCRALAQLSPTAPYHVRFEHGDNAEGQFWLIVDRRNSDGPPPAIGLPPAVGPQVGIDSTEYERVLYGVQATFRYHSSTVDYETDLVIAPEET